jgi:hypothetical protein
MLGLCLLSCPSSSQPPSHRSNFTRIRLTLVNKAKLLVQGRTSFACIHIGPDTMLIRKVTTPLDKRRTSTPPLVIGVCRERVQI